MSVEDRKNSIREAIAFFQERRDYINFKQEQESLYRLFAHLRSFTVLDRLIYEIEDADNNRNAEIFNDVLSTLQKLVEITLLKKQSKLHLLFKNLIDRLNSRKSFDRYGNYRQQDIPAEGTFTNKFMTDLKKALKDTEPFEESLSEQLSEMDGKYGFNLTPEGAQRANYTSVLKQVQELVNGSINYVSIRQTELTPEQAKRIVNKFKKARLGVQCAITDGYYEFTFTGKLPKN